MADPPPSYSESLLQQGPPAQGYGYGTAPPPPPGGYGTAPPPPSAGYGSVPPPAGYTNPGYPPQPYSNYPKQTPHPQYPPGPSADGGYQRNTVVVSQYPPQSVVLVGGCPACRMGVLEDDFTCMGVVCAILFFPLGILCCLAMRQRRCARCGAVFG